MNLIRNIGFFLFLISGAIAAADTPPLLDFSFGPDGRQWKLDSVNEADGRTIHEYYLEGEAPDDWTEKVTVHSFDSFPNITPEEYVHVFMQGFQKEYGNQDVYYRILKQNRYTVFWEWWVGEGTTNERHEWVRFIKGKGNAAVIRYSMKNAKNYSQAEVWKAIIWNGTLKNRQTRFSKLRESSPNIGEFNYFVFEADGFYFFVPRTWTIKKEVTDENQTISLIHAPLDKAVIFPIKFYIFKNKQDPMKVIETRDAWIKTKEYGEVDTTENISLDNGLNAAMITYKPRDQSVIMLVTIADDHHLAVLIVSIAQKHVHQMKKDLISILRTFNFTEGN